MCWLAAIAIAPGAAAWAAPPAPAPADAPALRWSADLSDRTPGGGAPDGGREAAPLRLRMAQASAVEAPGEGGGSPRFEIRRYRVEGNTLLSSGDIDAELAPFTGGRKDFGDVQRALEALQGLYQKRGYAGVLITLPEQELDRGEVRFRVIETRVGKIAVEGNQHFSAENARRSVPALVPGRTPNARDIAASVRVANENPAKQTAVLLRASEREGEVDAVIRMADVDPFKYSVSFDNTGNINTGKYRIGFALQHANLFDRDHVLTAQYLTSPENPSKVTVFGIGYRVPLYAAGDSIDLVAGYSDVNSGTVQDLFNVTGQGAVYALRYNKMLRRWGEVDHKITFGFDYRAYQNDVKPVGGGPNLIPDVSVRPFSMTYSGQLRQERQELAYYASWIQNITGGNDGREQDFKASRFDARAGYRIYRWGGSYSRHVLGQWQVRAAFNAQYSPDALVAGEQFGLGGADSVRGFNERYVSSDKGHRTNLELYTPDVGAQTFGGSDVRLRFLAFYDTGAVSRNSPQPGELRRSSLDSTGFGLRLNYKTHFSLKLDHAQVLHDGTQFGTPAGRTYANRWHLSTAWVF